MDAYLVFDLKQTFQFLKKKSFFNKKEKTVFITDKIIIFNLLKKNNIYSICLDSEINDSERKKIFLKNYNYFDKKLKKFGEKNYFNYKKNKINSIYNTYKGNAPRHYVGITLLFTALKRIIVKKKIKKIFYLNDLKNDIFNNNFYEEVFTLFCKKNNILFKKSKSVHQYKVNYYKNFFIFLLKLFFILKELNKKQVSNFFKKYFFNIFINKSSQNIAIIGPAFDLNYMDRNFLSFFYYDIELSYRNFLKKYPQKKNINISENNNLKNIEDIFLLYLKEQNLQMKDYFKEIISATYNSIKQKKVKKVLWGLSPSPFIRNVIMYLKKNFIVLGIQHGGKYFILEDDIIHKDLDYTFCHKFYSYGLNKSFNKKKFAPNTEIINSGCFKEKYNTKKLSEVNKKNISNNVLFVPTSLNVLAHPTIESGQTTRFNLQKKICRSLDKLTKVKKFVKVIPQTFFKKLNINYHHLETNPIYLELENYRSIKIDQNNLITAFQKIKPKIIITDYISTPVYELASSEAEIILFLDKYNYPKKDVIRSLRKRFFLVNNINQMNYFLNLILKKKISKSNNKEFYEVYYKEKNKLL